MKPVVLPSQAREIDREMIEEAKIPGLLLMEQAAFAVCGVLEQMELSYVHPVLEQPWGQRAVRFYDPDGHIIEVGENLKAVCRRFLDGGMTEEQVAKRMDVPFKFVRGCIRAEKNGER